MTHAATQLDFLFGRMFGVVMPGRAEDRPHAVTPVSPTALPAIEDPAAIARAQRGGRPARARLVGELQDIWFRYCLSMLGRPDAAKDAAQETALRFLRALPKFERRSTLKTWSLSIAINVCRERRRADQKHRGGPPSHDTPDTSPGPDQRAADSEQQHQLRENLQRLSERQREVVTLRYFEELSVNQTAEAMGCAAGTVKATLSQAIRAMRKLMEVRDDDA